jgi:hypothetical protein
MLSTAPPAGLCPVIAATTGTGQRPIAASRPMKLCQNASCPRGRAAAARARPGRRRTARRPDSTIARACSRRRLHERLAQLGHQRRVQRVDRRPVEPDLEDRVVARADQHGELRSSAAAVSYAALDPARDARIAASVRVARRAAAGERSSDFRDGWVRSAPPTRTVLAAYGTLHNPGDQHAGRDGRAQPDFDQRALHEMSMDRA